MSEVTVRTDGAVVAREERRRPGRRADVSPELIALMRAPSASARARVALYDAPGFLLQQGEVARRPRSRGHVMRVWGATVGMAAASGVAVQALLWACG